MPSHTEYEKTRLTKDQKSQNDPRTLATNCAYKKDAKRPGNILFMLWLIDNQFEDAAIHYCTIYPNLVHGSYNSLGDSILSRAKDAGCNRLSTYLVNKNDKNQNISSNLAAQLAAVTFNANKAHSHSAGTSYPATILTQSALSSNRKLSLASSPHRSTKKTFPKPV